MPAILNQLFEEDSERIICFAGPADQPVSMNKFKSQISQLRLKISGSSAESWLLYAENSCSFASGLLALLSLDKRVVICANSKPDWIAQFSDQFDAILSDTALNIDGKPSLGFSPDQQAHENSLDNWQPRFSGLETLVFFTSGSSGKAKAIVKPLLALTNEVDTLERSFGTAIETIDQQNKSANPVDSVFAASVSHHHIYGLLFRIFWPLLRKSKWLDRLVIFPEQLAPITAAFPYVIFASSPAFLSRLDPALPAITLDRTFSSGGPLMFEAATTAAKLLGGLPIEVYGSTETGGIAYRQQTAKMTPWTPFPGVVLKKSKIGVTISSPNIPNHEDYLLDDQLDISSDGKFELGGRRDRIAKIEEKRISLSEIERSLEDFDTITRCVAMVVTGKSGSRTVLACAVVLSDQGQEAKASHDDKYLIRQWKQALSQRFESVTIPKKWRILDEIPLTTQSKTDTAALVEYFRSVQSKK